MTDKPNNRFDLVLDKDYTVTITGDYKKEAGSDVTGTTAAPLVGIYDSRDGAPILRQLPRMPDFRQNPELLHDMLLDSTQLATAETVAGMEEPEAVTAAGDIVPVFRPGARVYDTDGNIYIVAYKTDSADRYLPALVLEYIEPAFASSIFLLFAKSATSLVQNLNSRIADAGMRIRNFSRELDKEKRDARTQDYAHRNAFESLDACASHYRSKADLHERQARVMYGALVQFASVESWTGEPDSPANKLTSSVNGYDIANLAMTDIAVDLLRQQILAESRT